MRELETIKAWLNKNRGKWREIAKAANVSTRTIYTILNEDQPNVSLRTLRKLQDAKKEWK